MVQRIAISDPRLRKLVDSAVSDLEEFYPDKRIRSLNKLHKGLCNRVGELWPQVGYASRDDFFAAYGFESDHSYNAAGGRPTTLDPEKLIAELEARYEGAPKPKTIGILMFENPDIKGQLKSLQNKSNELFGRSLAKEFKDRGLLAERSASSEVTDGDIQAMLDHLTAKYANAVTKPSTKSELEADNPGYEDVIAGFYDRSESIYGVKPRRKLIESGVYAKPATYVPDVDVREIEDAVIELGEMLCDLPSDEKPKTIADLAKAYPNQGERIKAGNKMGVSSTRNCCKGSASWHLLGMRSRNGEFVSWRLKSCFPCSLGFPARPISTPKMARRRIFPRRFSALTRKKASS